MSLFVDTCLFPFSVPVIVFVERIPFCVRGHVSQNMGVTAAISFVRTLQMEIPPRVILTPAPVVTNGYKITVGIRGLREGKLRRKNRGFKHSKLPHSPLCYR